VDHLGRYPQSDGPVWSDREWQLLKPLEEVATQPDVTMAQVAISGVATPLGIAPAIAGASSGPRSRCTEWSR
jgi:hypothetical protein